ncbi:MAG: Nif3-like dinuclear metal center hexameric protein, partial [Nanoarchaeota archaeon]|nr:Nif3-like dinuclear metal center hexameric protein [Nanoarchaeota archaeon]
MRAKQLYEQLEKDFIKPEFTDEWAKYMESISDFLTENFKKRSMGLVCNFAEEVNNVYTAVFPSNNVMKKVLEDGAKDAMLFVHHPSIWDIRKAPDIFYQMDRELLKKFKEMNVSIYNLHVPLDNHGEYSTAVSLARALKIETEKPFAPYYGCMSGVIGKVGTKNLQNLKKAFESAVGHKVVLYEYGKDEIKGGKVGIVAGGGNSVENLKELSEEGINVFISGVTVKNDSSREAHDFAESNRINILGGTHYST